jgi:DNA-binding CsgD family transcriptional regulator
MALSDLAVTDTDLLAVLDLILLVQAAATLMEYRSRVLRIRTLVPGHIVGYNEVAPSGQTFAVLDPPEAAFPGVEEVFATVAHEHPVIRRFQETGDVGPSALSDFLSRRELHSLDLYRLIFAPMEVEDQISIILPSTDGTVVGLAINRRERGFSERDRQVLGLVRPHLSLAFRDASRREAHDPLSDRRLRNLGLTARQAEVARALVRGGSASEIAARLVISPNTARKHITNVYERLGVHSRGEAIARLLSGPRVESP